MSSIFLTPLTIPVSILIDFLSLPDMLLKPSSCFEHKYQFSENKMTPDQIETMDRAFVIVFGKYEQKYKGKVLSLLDLIELHRVKFKIVDNLHDLLCLGNLDSKAALSNVQEYNLSKFLSTKCSMPDPSGEFKLGRVDIGMVYTIFKDADLYNYADIVMRKLRMGRLADEIKAKEDKPESEKADKSKPRELS
mmetsp:Transcript_30401/g.46568  ORF Transcript_30401/g.46568 Transcript_30401/m.46568 type:complete len:192 (-) Transcript_30401:423-998(-)